MHRQFLVRVSLLYPSSATDEKKSFESLEQNLVDVAVVRRRSRLSTSTNIVGKNDGVTRFEVLAKYEFPAFILVRRRCQVRRANK